MARVSICIPSYNPAYFEISLRSAIAQTYKDVEIIVSDDCPTDEIEAICARFSGLLTYSRNPNRGAINNIARLIKTANGEYIKFVFDDDVLNPFCTQYLVESLEETRKFDTNMAFSPRFFINGTGHITGYANFFNCEKSIKLLKGAEFIKVTAIRHHNLVGEYSTTLFRRADSFDDDGNFVLFDTDNGSLPDLEGWLHLARRGNFVIHPQPLSYFRQHDQATSNPANSPGFIACITFYERVQNFAIENGYLSQEELPESYRNLLNVYRYWVRRFPELQEPIRRFEGFLASGAR